MSRSFFATFKLLLDIILFKKQSHRFYIEHPTMWRDVRSNVLRQRTRAFNVDSVNILANLQNMQTHFYCFCPLFMLRVRTYIETHSHLSYFFQITAKSSVGSCVNTDRCTFPAHRCISLQCVLCISIHYTNKNVDINTISNVRCVSKNVTVHCSA